MLKCPYCFEAIEPEIKQCPLCQQFLLDPPVFYEFKSLEKKKCFFCGKKILAEAKVCRFCQKWLDSVNDAANDYDNF